MFVVCLSPCRYNPMWLYFHSPVAGLSLLVFEVSWSHTVGRTPLDEWSVRRSDLYLTTHNPHNRQTSMPPMEFEPTISAGERPKTYALDRVATGTGTCDMICTGTCDMICTGTCDMIYTGTCDMICTNHIFSAAPFACTNVILKEKRLLSFFFSWASCKILKLIGHISVWVLGNSFKMVTPHRCDVLTVILVRISSHVRWLCQSGYHRNTQM